MLVLCFLVASSLGCKPALTIPKDLAVITDLFPPELAKLMGVKTVAPNVPLLADTSKVPETEGSGEGPKIIKKISRLCAHSAKVELLTSYPWNYAKLDEYGALLEHDFRRLEKYSRTSVASFGGRMARHAVKVPTTRGIYYGQQFAVDGMTASCQTVKEFVRKAVSWSSTIPRATLTCRCEGAVVIQKISNK